MKTTRRLLMVTLLGWWTVSSVSASSAATNEESSPPGEQSAPAPVCRVNVDPRVELMSLVFRLAGNPEYNQARVPVYADAVDQYFGAHRNDEVIQLARRLRQTRGVSYDAVMSMAVHLTGTETLEFRLPFDPWPEGLDKRWTAEDAQNFLQAARTFVADTRFQQFIKDHQGFYDSSAARLRALLAEEGHLEWFPAYFGERAQASFTLTLGLLNGGSCYGPHFRDADGREELFCILGVWQTDADGQPEFTSDMLGTVVHEFCHSFANPIVDRHQKELEVAGQRLFGPMADRMRSQAYGNPQTLLRESLVRACTVRYLNQYEGSEAAQKAIQEQKRRGFLWTGELCQRLAEYEAQRDRYPTLESFAPRLVAFFDEYAEQFAKKQAQIRAASPQVLSMTPANGATDVDPGLSEIRVEFDRPMRDGSWSMVGGGDHFPEIIGRPRYDAAKRVWTVSVKLKPNWSYNFGLNSSRFDSFRSRDGVPLPPVGVTFTTGTAR